MMKLTPHMSKVKPADVLSRMFWNLVGNAQIVGSDLDLLGVGGNRESMMQGGSGTWTNLVDTDLTGWDKAGTPSPALSGPVSGVYTVDIDTVTSGAAAVSYTFATASTPRWGRCEARIVSGSIASDSANFFSMRDGTSETGTRFLTENLTSEWQTLDAYTGSVQSTQLAFKFTVGTKCTIEVRNMRATDSTSAAPAFPVGSAAGYVMADTLDRYGLKAVGVSAGYTTLTDDDLTNTAAWVPASAGGASNPVVSSPSAGVNQITFSTGVGETQVLKGTEPTTASENRIITMEARLISGSFAGVWATKLRWRDGTTAKGTEYDLSNIGSGWGIFDVSVTSADQTTEITFVVSGVCDAVIQIRRIRSAVSTARMPPVPVGSAAGTVVAVDAPACTPTVGTSGTKVQAAFTYGYSGGDNPVNAAAKFWQSEGPTMAAQIPGAIQIYGNNTGGSVTDGVITVISGDWNGTIHGARLNDGARITRADTDVPAGTLYIGNRSDKARPFHGIIVTIIFPWVLTDAQYTIVMNGLTQRLAGMELQ